MCISFFLQVASNTKNESSNLCRNNLETLQNLNEMLTKARENTNIELRQAEDNNLDKIYLMNAKVSTLN